MLLAACDDGAEFQEACVTLRPSTPVTAAGARFARYGAKPEPIMDGISYKKTRRFGTRSDVCEVEIDSFGTVVKTSFHPNAYELR
jgi:hypothetical protein